MRTTLPVRSKKPGNVPTARVAPILEALVRDRWPYSDEDVLSCNDLSAGYTVLADKAGCDPTTIVKIVRREYEGADFDLVDRLFCALGRPDVWRGELLDVYEGMQILERCQNPDCSIAFAPAASQGRTRKRYCSRACGWAAYNQRRGKTQRTLKAHRSGGSKRVCKNGHRRTAESTWVRKDGKRECLICKHEAARALYRAKSNLRQLDKTCEACGGSYTAHRVTQRFCSDQCRSYSRHGKRAVAA